MPRKEPAPDAPSKLSMAFGPGMITKTFEDSMSSFGRASETGKRTFDALGECARAAAVGAEAFGEDVLAYSKDVAERASTQARALAAAKTMQEAIELQTTYAKTAFDRYLAQVNHGLDQPRKIERLSGGA